MLVSILGVLIVFTGGILSGSAVWPMKLMKRYQFEHWWFVAMLTGLIVVPWTVTLVSCPNALRALHSVPWHTLVTANLWALGWGVANVLCGLCYVRLGIALTSVIVTGLGAATGVTMPLVVKGSGFFQHANDLWSRAGIILLCGVGVMLSGVALAGIAGAGRERARANIEKSSTSFLASLVMAVIAGVLSAGMGLSFVYAQGPIMQAMKEQGAGEIPSIFSVWAIALLGGGLLSVLYPVWLMLKNHSWKLIGQSRKEFVLAMIIGINASLAVVLLGAGMRMVGPLGASVGLGLQTGAWMIGGQLVGFASGEWRGSDDRLRKRIYLAILCLIAGMIIMVFGNLFGKAW